MPFKIVRNDLTKMQVDVVVNTANAKPRYGNGIDFAIYQAAGEEQLLEARKKIGKMEEGEAAITSGFNLPAKYIIHAVSPLYRDGKSGEEDKLRACYQNSFRLALEKGCKSIAFPLIATGQFGYPKEEGMEIAVNEINHFLLYHEMMVFLVVFDEKSTNLAKRLQSELDAYINEHYVEEKVQQEYKTLRFSKEENKNALKDHSPCTEWKVLEEIDENSFDFEEFGECDFDFNESDEYCFGFDDLELDDSRLKERLTHISDTFQEYLFYLIKLKGITNPEVYTNALITKQTFSKIKKNPNYHPDKATALRLCIGARLSLDETKDLLARAGYALSPCDKMDIIFTFYIENKIYDMYALDISLEKYGLPCFIG